MTVRGVALASLLLLGGCSPDPDDVPPLPKENAETARQLMTEAERAAADAQKRAERAQPQPSSDVQPKEVTP